MQKFVNNFLDSCTVIEWDGRIHSIMSLVNYCFWLKYRELAVLFTKLIMQSLDKSFAVAVLFRLTLGRDYVRPKGTGPPPLGMAGTWFLSQCLIFMLSGLLAVLGNRVGYVGRMPT